MPWKEFEFKGQRVWVRTLATGKPMVHRGRVEVRYRRGGGKAYRASPENLVEVEGELLSDAEFGGSPAGTPAPSAAGLRETPTRPADDDTIVIHTDGACSGNPGPAGIGIYLERADEIVEVSEYLGEATNNIAELMAILRALELVREEERSRSIHLYTDSGWSLGVLVGGWNAKANLEIIHRIQAMMRNFPALELLKVRGHAGQSGNTEADELATMAVRREDSKTRTRKRRSA
jgi:ribonuclease HI